DILMFARLSRCLQGRLQPTHFIRATMEPVRAPYSMEPPTQAFKHLLTKTVTFTRPYGRVVAGPVAFHRQHVAAIAIGVVHGQIDLEASGTDLVVDVVAQPSDLGRDRDF